VKPSSAACAANALVDCAALSGTKSCNTYTTPAAADLVAGKAGGDPVSLDEEHFYCCSVLLLFESNTICFQSILLNPSQTYIYNISTSIPGQGSSLTTMVNVILS
jgi:hypothetical protein